MKAYKTLNEDSSEASGGSRCFWRFFLLENKASMGGCQCDTGAQRVTQNARGLPAAPLGFEMASPRRYGLTGSLRAAPTASNAGPEPHQFFGRAGFGGGPRAARVARLVAVCEEGSARRGTGWRGRGGEIN